MTGKLVLEVIAKINAELGTTAEVITHNAASKTLSAPWLGRFKNYAERGGMRVPFDGKVAWLLPEGKKA